MKDKGDWSRTLVVSPFNRGIPTLEKGVYQPITAQLRERYELFGRWQWATHGHWLSTLDMQSIWADANTDELLICA
jgi:hypothetical protein